MKVNKDTDKKEVYKIIEWLKGHPLIKISPLEKMAGVPARDLQKAIDGQRGLPEKHAGALAIIIAQYGYK